jgi:hypothetical protein
MAAAIPLNDDLDVGAYYNFDYFVIQDEGEDGFASERESIRNAKLLSSQDAWVLGTRRHPHEGLYPHHTFSAPFYGQPKRDFIAREMYNVKKTLPPSHGSGLPAKKPTTAKKSATAKKEILGKMRKIYKIPGDRKEYVKHKGKLITVKDYKKLMKAKKPKKK